MTSQKVNHTVVEMVVNLADLGGVPLVELCSGLPVNERELRHRLVELPWDVFAELMERLEARLGAARMEAMARKIEVLSPIGLRLLGRFLSAAVLMRFVCRLIGPSMYPMYETSWRELPQPDGGLVGHLTLQLKPGLRGCRGLFGLHGIATAALPRMMGQPALPLRMEVTERSGEYWFTLRDA